MRIATAGVRTGFAMTPFTRGAVQARTGGQRRPPLRMTRKFVKARERADVGSELSAASGRSSEVSEWPRSKF